MFVFLVIQNSTVFSSVVGNKRIAVSLETKCSAIKSWTVGNRLKILAADLRVGEVTVGDWRRNLFKK